MPRGNHRYAWIVSHFALLLTLTVVSFAQETHPHIVLPDTKLLGCQAPACPQLVSDDSTDPSAIHPWQIMVDFNQGQVIGLTVYYDKPASFDDVRAAIDERYAKWTASFSDDKLRAWRIEPEKFVIQMTTTGGGMVQVVYLVFDPKHPTSDEAQAYMWCAIAQAEAHCAHKEKSFLSRFLPW